MREQNEWTYSEDTLEPNNVAILTLPCEVCFTNWTLE